MGTPRAPEVFGDPAAEAALAAAPGAVRHVQLGDDRLYPVTRLVNQVPLRDVDPRLARSRESVAPARRRGRDDGIFVPGLWQIGAEQFEHHSGLFLGRVATLASAAGFRDRLNGCLGSFHATAE